MERGRINRVSEGVTGDSTADTRGNLRKCQYEDDLFDTCFGLLCQGKLPLIYKGEPGGKSTVLLRTLAQHLKLKRHKTGAAPRASMLDFLYQCVVDLKRRATVVVVAPNSLIR